MAYLSAIGVRHLQFSFNFKWRETNGALLNSSHCRRLETAAPWPAAHQSFLEIVEPTSVARNSFRVRGLAVSLR